MLTAQSQILSPDAAMVADLVPQHFPVSSDVAAGVREVSEGVFRCEVYSLDSNDVFALTLPFSDADGCCEYAEAINRALGVNPSWAKMLVSFCQKVDTV